MRERKLSASRWQTSFTWRVLDIMMRRLETDGGLTKGTSFQPRDSLHSFQGCAGVVVGAWWGDCVLDRSKSLWTGYTEKQSDQFKKYVHEINH